MKTCGEYCLPCCEYCITYRDYYDVDADYELTNAGFGLCSLRNEIVIHDSSCDHFHCLSAWRQAVMRETPEQNVMLDIRKKNPGRSELKSWAAGIVLKFACSAHYYAWLAYHHGLPDVTIDLFAIHIKPVEFDVERNRILATYCRDNLLELIARFTATVSVTSAILSAHFGIEDFRSEGNFDASIGRSVFTLTLTDDRGKEWVGRITDERVLAQD